jgi:hypothetical protein
MEKSFIPVLLFSWMTISCPASIYCQVSILTYHNDNSRSGLNASETVLTPSNVNQSQFGRLFSVAVDGFVFAQPLYVPNVSIPGQGTRNVIYVGTENDSVYAIDADLGVVLWTVSFINPAAGITTVPDSDVGCDDIPSEMGITGTPVIDPSSNTSNTSNTLYLVAQTKENGVWTHRLHALDITTGAEKFGGPVVIQASVPGTGTDNVKGVVSFNSLRENQRPALLLSNGVIFIGFGSHCDRPPYHGWLLAYETGTLQQVGVFNVTPNAEKGGIWQAGGGIAADANGLLYAVTGNGTFDVNLGGTDYGDSYLQLRFTPPFTVADYFTPYNQASLDSASNEQEPGSGGALLLPNQTGSYPHLMIGAGKQGVIYLLNRDNMGQYNSSTNVIVQQISGQLGSNYSTPAFWQNNIYFGAVSGHLKSFALTNGVLSSTPTSQAPTEYGFPGATPSVSANGSSNGIVWAVETTAYSSNGPAVLHAYNATNLATELYNSNQNLARDNPGPAVKFSVPTIANGNVYVGAQMQVSAYGVLPPDYFWMAASPTVQTVSAGGTTSYTVSVNALAGSTATVNLTVGGLPPGASFSFNPSSVTGSGTSTLTIVTTSSTPVANYVVQFSGSSSTGNWTTTATLSVQPALPAPWAPQVVGNESTVGTTTYNVSANTYTLQGSGTVGGDVDAFQFAYQPWSGDGQVIAFVASEQNTSSYAQAGVMIRETLNAGATEASLFVTPGHGISFVTRTCTGCASSTTTGPQVVAPYWVWILRQGNTFSGWASNDGVHWSFVASATINMATAAYAGLAVSANTATKLNTSTFNNVTVAAPSPNFSLTATPSLATLAPSGSSTYEVTVNSFAGFSDTMTLGKANLPAGVSASFNPASVAGSGSSALTLTASGSTPTATSPFSIVGTSSTLTYPTPLVVMTGGPLPNPWTDQDIGTFYSTGGATYNGSSGTFSVAASASDIAGTADAFHYVYQPLSGDGQLIAQVAAQGNTSNWAKAGVMIRETLNANSRHASMLLTVGNGALFERRTCTGCSPTSTSVTGVQTPYWVEVVRQGNTFNGYVSPDGVNWTLVGSVTITMNEDAYIGLAVTSHATTLNTSTFVNVQ